MNRAMRKCAAHADNKGLDKTDQGLCCPFTELLDTVEYIDERHLSSIVESCYLEVQGTLLNTLRYP